MPLKGARGRNTQDKAVQALTGAAELGNALVGEEKRAAVRRLVLAIAEHRSAAQAANPGPIFDAERAWRWICVLPDPRVRRALMRFASWLWSTGTHDMDLLMAILEDRCRRNPDNPYAYYAPGGTARDCRTAQHSIASAEAENEAFKLADRLFLSNDA